MLAKRKLSPEFNYLASRDEPGYRVFWNVVRGDLHADILKRIYDYAGGYNSPASAMKAVNELLEMADHIIGKDNNELYGVWSIVSLATNSVFKSGTIKSNPTFLDVS